MMNDRENKEMLLKLIKACVPVHCKATQQNNSLLLTSKQADD